MKSKRGQQREVIKKMSEVNNEKQERPKRSNKKDV